MSSDGSTVIGWAEVSLFPQPERFHSFRWGPNGMEALPALSDWDVARAVAPDGSVVIGNTAVASGFPPRDTFRWEDGTGTAIGLLPPGHAIYGASANLDVLVGATSSAGFYWTPTTGIVHLSGFDYLLGVSAAGSFLVGNSSVNAVRVPLGGAVEVIAPPPGWHQVEAIAVSDDGTVVGSLYDNALPSRAFVWRAGTGFEVLESAATNSDFATGVSASGLVIVGYRSVSGIDRACIWANGRHFDLHDLLTASGVTSHLDWTLGLGPHVGVCGRILTGGAWLPNSRGEAYIAVLPEGVDCYGNCDMSLTPPVLNVADFTCFLQRFSAGDPYTNCDQSMTPPVLNVADFTCFLQRFAAGCP